MTTYLVSYDLVDENSSHDYKPLWAELDRLGGQKTQYSLWLVGVNNSAQELHDHLKGFLDKNDRLWVAELVKNHHFSNAMAGTNDFLKKNPPAR